MNFVRKAPLLFILLLLLSAYVTAGAQPPAAPPPDTQQSQEFSRQVATTFTGRYLISLPDGYTPADKQRWPLIVYLHGANGRGANVEQLKEQGLTYFIAQGRKYPFIIVSPQCPADEWWDSHWMIETINALLDELQAKYSIDEDRVYLTGWSMGGSGVWHLAAAHPERFAAIAPLSGKGVAAWGERLKNVPVWAFHGAADKTVSPEESRAMVDAVKAAGGEAKLTVYPGEGHEIWQTAYNEAGLFQWFLAHKRIEPRESPGK